MEGRQMISKPSGVWHQVTPTLPSLEFECGYCDRRVASTNGYLTNSLGQVVQLRGYIYICPNCNRPSYKCVDEISPTPAPGSSVEHVPNDINGIYAEARAAAGAGAFTAAVLACRKLLMNIAVAEGAAPNLRFIEYVDYLANKGFVPPNGRSWVDHIRTKGNEATHEIALMTKDDATELITFSEMLLKFIYEFPSKVPQKKN